MSNAGFILTLLGVAGIGGATETGNGLGLSITFFIIGALLLYIGEKGGIAKVKRIHYDRNNCHSYPAGLDGFKRRA